MQHVVVQTVISLVTTTWLRTDFSMFAARCHKPPLLSVLQQLLSLHDLI